MVQAPGSHFTLSKLHLTEQKKNPGDHHPRREKPRQYVLLHLLFFFFLIYLFLAVLGLRHWVFVAVRRLSLVAASWVYSSLVVCGLLIAVASLVAEQGL